MLGGRFLKIFSIKAITELFTPIPYIVFGAFFNYLLCKVKKRIAEMKAEVKAEECRRLSAEELQQEFCVCCKSMNLYLLIA